MYNKQKLSITWLTLLSYMTTHIDKSPIMAEENTCAGPESWARENRFLLSFIFRYNVWLLTLAKILITHGCFRSVYNLTPINKLLVSLENIFQSNLEWHGREKFKWTYGGLFDTFEVASSF